MTDAHPQLLVVSLREAVHVDSSLADYAPERRLCVCNVDPRQLERQLREAAPSWSSDVLGAVAIDQRFMGQLAARAAYALADLGIPLPPLVHPTACVARSARLNDGARVAAGAIIGADVVVGRHARVLERAVLEHGTEVGEHTTIDPGVLVGAHARIGRHCWLRSSVIIAPLTTVGDDCELHLPGRFTDSVPAGTLFLAGLDGPARIVSFG